MIKILVTAPRGHMDSLIIREAVRSSEKVCLLADEGTDMSWLTEYLEERGEPGMLLRIGSAGEGVEVYQFLSEERINEMFRGEEIDAED